MKMRSSAPPMKTDPLPLYRITVHVALYKAAFTSVFQSTCPAHDMLKVKHISQSKAVCSSSLITISPI